MIVKSRGKVFRAGTGNTIGLAKMKVQDGDGSKMAAPSNGALGLRAETQTGDRAGTNNRAGNQGRRGENRGRGCRKGSDVLKTIL